MAISVTEHHLVCLSIRICRRLSGLFDVHVADTVTLIYSAALALQRDIDC
jgi:hypothetical protein